MFRKLIKLVALVFIRLDLIWPFYFFTLLKLRKIKGSGDKVPKSACVIRFLALNNERFRGELEALVNSGEVEIWGLPVAVQVRWITCFFKALPGIIELHQDTNPTGPRAQYQIFLAKILAKLVARLGIRGILSNNFSYRQDFDWATAGTRIGLKYIVLLRGGIASTEKISDELRRRFSTYGTFKGDYILTHNRKFADLLIESGYGTESNTLPLGSLRLNRVMQDTSRGKSKVGARKVLSLFSFPHCTGLTGSGMFADSFSSKFDGVWAKDSKFGFVKLFESVHYVVAKIALQNPEVRVIIKSKWGGDWFLKIRDAIERRGLFLHDLPNLEIVADIDPYDLMNISTVICGFGSTTLVEAGIFDAPIIVPDFEEAVCLPYSEYVQFRDLYPLFNVAGSEQELIDLISRKLRSPDVEAGVRSARRRAFETHISSIERSPVSRYVEFLKTIVE